jgi:predicted acetyltransferase
MDKLVLLKPDLTFKDEIVSYRKEFLEAGSSMDGCGSLRRHSDPRDWLSFNEILENRETVPEYWVQSSQFIYIREPENRIVGMIQVRHFFNEFLEKYGGNIGYSVRPSERRKGYAAQMLHDLLPYCREIGLSRVLITCLTDNEGSRRTILKNGGVYESTVFEPKEKVHLERYWITL